MKTEPFHVRCRACPREDVVHLPGDERAIFEQGWMVFTDEAHIKRGYCVTHNPVLAALTQRRLTASWPFHKAGVGGSPDAAKGRSC